VVQSVPVEVPNRILPAPSEAVYRDIFRRAADLSDGLGGQFRRLADGMAATHFLRELVQPPEGMMGVDLADGRRVFAPIGSDPDVVRARIESGEIAPC